MKAVAVDMLPVDDFLLETRTSPLVEDALARLMARSTAHASKAKSDAEVKWPALHIKRMSKQAIGPSAMCAPAGVRQNPWYIHGLAPREKSVLGYAMQSHPTSRFLEVLRNQEAKGPQLNHVNRLNPFLPFSHPLPHWVVSLPIRPCSWEWMSG